MTPGGRGPARRRSAVVAALGSLLALLGSGLAGCTSEAGSPPEERPAARPAGTAAPTACGPVTADRVRGRVPSYVVGGPSRFANDRAACGAVWLAAVEDGFVAQGLAVSGRTAWVSGFPGDAPVGRKLCRVQRVDLRTGRVLADLDPLVGAVGSRPEVACRHGGGLARDAHGLWVAELARLWLLDPDDLTVRRVWDVVPPLRGSFTLVDDRGRLGLGRFRAHAATRLDWLDPAALLRSSDVTVDGADVVGSVRAPAGAQGAVWASLGGMPAGVWFATSTTRCGVLVGPGGRRRGLVPGAEGLALAGPDRLWVVSESGTAHYQAAGSRPVVPTLTLLATDDVRRWDRPACSL
ncbi:hypothetical protein H5V45_08220 [Nocardioides sp. KIGAM211]|uniref:SMP-30/Gluconolactonase/LRE-like region domain-containing protein n=1 Tax=Nocardioides luti TaxID=2761101 RepID=A0A7X0RH92_9ACTN|nr:hypothetical protein [Nocardioides luti]MBB6627305.1 hypothetical protein [Nocardioides luti]